jgi:hypothetical protein
MPLEDKIRTVATEIYGAADIAVSSAAKTKLKKFTKMGYGHYPICVAKNQYSFSGNYFYSSIFIIFFLIVFQNNILPPTPPPQKNNILPPLSISLS